MCLRVRGTEGEVVEPFLSVLALRGNIGVDFTSLVEVGRNDDLIWQPLADLVAEFVCHASRSQDRTRVGYSLTYH